MFGFSLPKLLVLVAIILGVLVAYRYLGSKRVGRDRDEASRGSSRVEDLEECSRCGAFVSVGAVRDCERADCPY